MADNNNAQEKYQMVMEDLSHFGAENAGRVMAYVLATSMPELGHEGALLVNRLIDEGKIPSIFLLYPVVSGENPLSPNNTPEYMTLCNILGIPEEFHYTWQGVAQILYWLTLPAASKEEDDWKKQALASLKEEFLKIQRDGLV